MKLTFKSIVLSGIFCFHWVEILCLASCSFFNKRKFVCNRILVQVPLLVLLGVFLYSLLTLNVLGYDWTKSFQQTFLFVIFIVLYGNFFSLYKGDIDNLFKSYLKTSYVICLLGFFQVIFFAFTTIDVFSYFTRLGDLQKFSNRIIRLRSICPEAGNLGTLLSPAVVYIVYFKDKWNILGWKKWVILSAGFMTASTPFFVTLCVSLYFRFISKGKIIDIIVAAVCIFWGAGFLLATSQNYQKTSSIGSDGLKMRIFETTSLLFSLDDLDKMENSNASTYAWMTNLYVARHAPFRLLGTGLGTHQQNYVSIYRNTKAYAYGLNSEDGYSLLNRIFSELGILGLVGYLYLVFRHVSRKDVVSFSLLFFLVGSFLRGGNYFLSGCIFFHYFYFIAKEHHYRMKQKKTQISTEYAMAGI